MKENYGKRMEPMSFPLLQVAKVALDSKVGKGSLLRVAL